MLESLFEGDIMPQDTAVSRPGFATKPDSLSDIIEAVEPEWPWYPVAVLAEPCEVHSKKGKQGRGNTCKDGTCPEVEGYKCVCVVRWRLLPKGKMMGYPKGGNPVNTAHPITDVTPKEDPAQDKKRTTPSLNPYVDSKAGCKCLCHKPNEPDPSDPGGPTSKYHLPPKKDENGKPGDVEKEGSEWNWDSEGYKTPEEVKPK
jgi:hypothetical protein